MSVSLRSRLFCSWNGFQWTDHLPTLQKLRSVRFRSPVQVVVLRYVGRITIVQCLNSVIPKSVPSLRPPKNIYH